jgi:hypothetical protein
MFFKKEREEEFDISLAYLCQELGIDWIRSKG